MERPRVSINYLSPPETHKAKQIYTHRFVLSTENQPVGTADMVYFCDPIPFYFLANLDVDWQQQGKGYGRSLLQTVNNELMKRSRPGVLLDTTTEQPARGMYARHGWVPLEDAQYPQQEIFYGFNFKEPLTPVQFDRLVKRLDDVYQSI